GIIRLLSSFVIYNPAHVLAPCYNCLVVEYLPGKDLYEYREEVELTHKMVLEICKGILVPLEYIHSVGVVHGDIKPENIIYNDQTHEIKLIDFGLAKSSKIDDA